MSQEELKELDGAYNTAWLGTLTPEFGIITCEKCGQSFLLVKGKEKQNSEKFCSHLKEIFSASPKT